MTILLYYNGKLAVLLLGTLLRRCGYVDELLHRRRERVLLQFVVQAVRDKRAADCPMVRLHAGLDRSVDEVVNGYIHVRAEQKWLWYFKVDLHRTFNDEHPLNGHKNTPLIASQYL